MTEATGSGTITWRAVYVEIYGSLASAAMLLYVHRANVSVQVWKNWLAEGRVTNWRWARRQAGKRRS